MRPFGQYLKAMVRGLDHDGKDLADEVRIYASVKKVAHGVDEDCPRLSPAQRHSQNMRMQRHAKSIGIVATTRGLEAQREPFSVTVATTDADLSAAGNRVPCGLGPFNF